MKKIKFLWYAAVMALLGIMMPACNTVDIEGEPELPNLPRVSNLAAAADGFDLVLSWTLPNTNLTISGLTVSRINDETGQAVQTWDLEPTATTFTVVGAPMGVERGYTVKVKYADGYSSTGETIFAALPEMQLSPVTNLQASVERRAVTLSWTLPQMDGLTGIHIFRSDDPDGGITLTEPLESYVMKSQPMDSELTYNVEAIYAENYFAPAATVDATVPYVATQAGFLLFEGSFGALTDDDEIAAATWFAQQPDATFVTLDQLATLDPEEVSVLWIMVDRMGLEAGWQNLPAPLVSESTIAALKAYTANGGALYLSNMATQLTAPIGIVPMDMAPNIFSSGAGGPGDDVWVINPHLGWDFQGSEIYYDRAEHALYDGIVMEDPNGYGYSTIPLIGPGQREDHNCMWDLNVKPPFGEGNQPDVIRNFEVTTNCMVMATWGHVRDHCVAGLVIFMENMEHGRCIANGFAAYEWNQNSGPNPYQGNVEKLTSNIINYLK